MSSQRYGPVELLTATHNVDDFDCGSERETTWLCRRALAAQNSRANRAYVVRRRSDDRVIGFHALATSAVLPVKAPDRVAEGIGTQPISVIALTRLGVDLSERRQHLGRSLLVDALQRVNAAADIVGVRALLIHTANEQARDFYLGLAEFEASPTDPLHLFLLIKDLRRSLS
jgi:GNAT superfamily N-acetyltransferase